MTEKEYRRWRFWQEAMDVTAIMTVVLAFWLMAACMLYLAVMGLEERCKTNATEMRAEYRYDALNGCRISTSDGRFVNWEFIVVPQ